MGCRQWLVRDIHESMWDVYAVVHDHQGYSRINVGCMKWFMIIGDIHESVWGVCRGFYAPSPRYKGIRRYFF